MNNRDVLNWCFAFMIYLYDLKVNQSLTIAITISIFLVSILSTIMMFYNKDKDVVLTNEIIDKLDSEMPMSESILMNVLMIGCVDILYGIFTN